MADALSLAERRDRSALLIRVPEAESLVGAYRRDFTADGRRVPPHVTLLSPFLAPVETTEEHRHRINQAIAGVEAFQLTFARTGWFGDQILYLAPESTEAIIDLVSRLRTVAPEIPPYWDTYGLVTPHLTVADVNLAGGVDKLRQIERALTPNLPIATTVREITLMQRIKPSPEPWDVTDTYPLLERLMEQAHNIQATKR